MNCTHLVSARWNTWLYSIYIYSMFTDTHFKDKKTLFFFYICNHYKQRWCYENVLTLFLAITKGVGGSAGHWRLLGYLVQNGLHPSRRCRIQGLLFLSRILQTIETMYNNLINCVKVRHVMRPCGHTLIGIITYIFHNPNNATLSYIQGTSMDAIFSVAYYINFHTNIYNHLACHN